MEPPETDTASGDRAARVRSSAASSVGSIRAIADVPFLLQTDDAARWAVLDAFTQAWEEPTDTDGAPDPAPVSFYFSAEPIPLPDRAPDLAGLGQAQWLVDDRLYISDNPGCTAVAAADEVTISGPASLRMLERAVGPALGYVLGYRGLLTLHAAAFVLPGVGAVLATGRTGTGKSTLAGIALREGWPVLSDDTCIVDVDRVPRVTGLPRAPAIPTEIAQGLPGVVGGQVDGRQRHQLTPGGLTRGWHTLAALVRVEHGEHALSQLLPRDARSLVDDVLFGQMGATTTTQLRATLLAATRLARFPGFMLRHAIHTEARASSGAERLREMRATLC